MAYCAYCGSELSGSSAACSRCGHPVGARVASQGQQVHAYGYPDGDLAGFWTRFVARLIDGLVLLIPSLLLSGPRRGFNVAGYAISFLYDWLMVGMNNGQTLGKAAMGIRVVTAARTPLDLGRAAARAGMSIVSGLALALGYLWAAWDPERRTWHDMVADTRVVRSR